MSIPGPADQLRKIVAELRDGVYHNEYLPLDEQANLADRLEEIAKAVAQGYR